MKEIYSWIPWFRDLVREIDKGGPDSLNKRARRVTWNEGGKAPPLLNSEVPPDPFSFVYQVAAKNRTSKSQELVYPSISKVFGIRELQGLEAEDSFIYPTPSERNIRFHAENEENLELLWRLFRNAVRGADPINGRDFDTALEIKGVAIAKLTQALFLISPHKFLPLDTHTLSLGVSKPPKEPKWADYQNAVATLCEAFPGCKPHDINMFAFLQSSNQLQVDSSKFFQVSTNVKDDGKDCWEDFDSNNCVYTGAPKSGTSWEKYDLMADQRDIEGGYPLKEPTQGDVVLVRTGVRKGRGIGLVYRNDYRDGLDGDKRLHVLWLNKKTASFSRAQTMRKAFAEAGPWTKTAFQETKEYKPTFKLLARLGRKTPTAVAGKHAGIRDVDPPAQDKTLAVEHARNQILYGPPGTGKTWSTVRHAMAIIKGVEVQNAEDDRQSFDSLRFDPESGAGQIAMVTFHQNFAYEDFVEGIRPKLAAQENLRYELHEGVRPKLAAQESLRYELHEGIFKRMARAAEQSPAKRFVLIIDEINRGNVAKILGELITLLEGSRRIGQADQTYVTLPYSNDKFGVPDNLYIIGTMNTADRSIQLLDTALRRRFEFIEMMPNPGHERIPENVEGVDCPRMLKTMNERITALLDREHQIGHTYLFKVNSMKTLSEAFRNNIFPLLQEYFFDDWSKIRLVLNENSFVKTRPTAGLFSEQAQADEIDQIYQRLPDGDPGWENPAEYQKIYAAGPPDAVENS